MVVPDDESQKASARVPTGDWMSRLKDLSFSYTGEMVLTAQRLTLRQFLPILERFVFFFSDRFRKEAQSW